MSKLMIVESPTKARKIGSFLGDDFVVEACLGHVREIPPNGINIDIDNGFSPTFVVSDGKKEVVKRLKSLASKAEIVYLASDKDREGEAIAWHLYDLFDKATQKKCKRAAYDEINEKSVKKAIAEARSIDMNLVSAQRARQVLDRLIGYKISPVVWYAVAKGTSAGRVQSIALKLICDRQKEIDSFKSVTYWHIDALLKCDNGQFWARTVVPGQKDNRFLEEQKATEVLDALKASTFTLSNVDRSEKSVNPPAPFDTTSLQSACSAAFKWPAMHVARVAQSLYENGRISYIRTDSYNISQEALDEVRQLISANHGPKFLPKEPNKYHKKSTAAAQEAHECIRPTHVDDDGSDLTEDEKDMYDLIRRRFIACQMTPMILDTVKYEVSASCKEKLFATGKTVRFEGFSKVWKADRTSEENLPLAEKGEKLILEEAKKSEHKTKPPDRFTDGTLMKKMEDEGVGRPATRASILKSLTDKGYVKKDKAAFVAQPLGISVCDFLSPAFKDFIMNIKFTSNLEDDLDKIAKNERSYLDVVGETHTKLVEEIKKAKSSKPEKKTTGHKCSICNKGDIIERVSGKGSFFACTNYPECKTIFDQNETKDGFIPRENKNKAKPTDKKCPKCKKSLVIRGSRYGEFIGCSGFPSCRYSEKIGGEKKE